ncbi:MAG: extracellular solute-binding protein [Synergistaceae bacterium]|nr:extracellular solute-binding protein [Synergistaceae bacterium]
MKFRHYLIITMSVLLLCFVALTIQRGGDGLPDPNRPVSVAMWHTYVEQMKTCIDELVAEFNATVGKKEGIVVNVTAVSNASVLNEKIIMAANGDPGAPELPDMALVYPSVAITLAAKGLLMDFRTQFSGVELSAYVPRFLEEGKLGGSELYLLPVAKSTEVLYVNATIFERFSRDTGVTLSDLSTFEGITNAARLYYEWTDAKTPDIPNDGKTFYYPDIPFNFAMTGFEQLGDHFVKDGALDFSSPSFGRIWNCYYPGAVTGSIAIFDDYGNYLAKAGEIVCTTSTSAGAIFYPETVTYADNTKEESVFVILPYPVFEGGQKIAPQRGAGMCTFKSSKEKEYATAVFLKWLTNSAQNLRFVINTGYLPVTNEAFSDLMSGKYTGRQDANIQKMLSTAVAMHQDYKFYIPPVFDGFDELQKGYVEKILKFAEKDRHTYLSLLKEHSPARAFEILSHDALQRFIK